MRNGMVVTDWLVPGYLRTYKSGLFQMEKEDDMYKLNKSVGYTGLPNHASVIVGWGADENSKPYWIVRNSFGEQFGMGGDMYVPRGQNAFQVETDIIGFEPELLD